MRRLPPLLSIAFLGALISGCGDQPPPTDTDPSSDLATARGGKIRGGGFDGAGNEGLVPGTLWPPLRWRRAADIGQSEFARECGVEGHCAVGHAGFRSFAGLRTPSNQDPNPIEGPGGGGRSFQFAVISTTNFFSGVDSIVTNQSAIVRSFTLPVGGWQLQVDLAFLTGETGIEAQSDFAAITIKSLTARGSPDEMIRLEVNDPLAWKPGGCSPQRFGDDGITSYYPRCTDWRPYSVDVSRFGGQKIEVEVRVGEGGPDNDVATSLAIDNLKFVQVNLLPVVGPISVSLSPDGAGWSLRARAEFADGDPTDKHRAVWNWGDGTSTTPATLKQGAGFGSVSNSHQYRRPGIYTITLTVIDKPDGGIGRRRRQITFDDLVTNSPARESGIGLANSRVCLNETKHGTWWKGCGTVALVN